MGIRRAALLFMLFTGAVADGKANEILGVARRVTKDLHLTKIKYNGFRGLAYMPLF